jgi:Hemerythrin HHE cation binding domain
MTVDIAGFRDAHHELLEHAAELCIAAERFPTLATAEREQTRGYILSLLRERIDPHTKLDELLLYPEVATRLGDPLVAASMNYDHLAIRRWIALIAAADVNDTAHLQQLLYGLDALIRVHIWKENELFLASLESRSWPTLATARAGAETSAG